MFVSEITEYNYIQHGPDFDKYSIEIDKITSNACKSM